MQSRLGLPLSILLLAVGCSSDDDDTGSDSTCLPDCEGTRDYDAISYDLRGRFDWDQERMTASEQIVLETDEAPAVVELDTTVAIERVYAGDHELPFAADPEAATVTIDLSGLSGPTYTFSVDYTAAASDSMIVSRGGSEDPVTTRIVYTSSEVDTGPEAGVAWLVAKQETADRALFSFALTVEPGEDVIANGNRVADRDEDGGRVVGYKLDQPISTYLMAFAAGEIEHTDRTAGSVNRLGDRVPLSLWHRKGLVVDAEANLDIMESQMAIFEELLGPYPWETYSVVLVPDYGGMENVTVTFNGEGSGQGNIDVYLHAHELAHQWYGNWVTIATLDDLWVKESMATLLQEEADRARQDGEGRGRLWGAYFDFDTGDTIVDRSLEPQDKFTSGPYERAASLVTQIRATVGEEAFWESSRAVLSDHALGSIDGATFVRSFPLDEATADRLIASLTRSELPRMIVTIAPAAEGTTAVSLALEDPAGQLIAPFQLAAIGPDGAATEATLAPGGAVELVIPDGGYLSADELDLWPDWEQYLQVDDYEELLAPLLVPQAPASDAAMQAFTSRSAAVQEVALGWTTPPLAADDFAAFYAQLDSVWAQNELVIAACEEHGTDPAWQVVLAPMIVRPAVQEMDTDFMACPAELARELLGAEMASVLDSPSLDALARAEYLLSFDYGAESLGLIGRIASDAPTLRLRELAAASLTEQAGRAARCAPGGGAARGHQRRVTLAHGRRAQKCEGARGHRGPR